jgi:hypothetical protein
MKQNAWGYVSSDRPSRFGSPTFPPNLDDEVEAILTAPTIQVSGYPAISAVRVLGPDGNLIGTIAGSVDLAMKHGTTWTHCPPCNRALRPEQERRQSLGFPLCPACDETWRETCKRLHGRLPMESEFFCMGCQRIMGHGELARRYGDGRQRWRCMTCRGRQRAWTPKYNANRQARRHGLL